MKSLLIFAFCISTAFGGYSEYFWRQKNQLPPAFANDPYLTFLQESNPGGRIIGGQDSDIANFPYQLSLRENGNHNCGASVIAPYWALTAAHCVYPATNVQKITLRAGSSFRLSGGVLYQAVEIIVHPEYNPNTSDLDVALIRVSKIFEGENVDPIPMAPVDLEISGGTASVVSGWGLTSEGTLPAQLKSVTIPVVKQQLCSLQWGFGRITDNMICAGEAGHDSCNGDSGGPLVTGGRQIGIVSWGSSKCGGSLPGVYTRISSNPIRSFIQKHAGV